ncbi:MAG: hypothetical protein ACI9G1_001844 [Pirellulaceae bacterium]|jgi:hypothetical protein
MPEVFDQNGLRVIYPENWEVDEHSTANWPKSVSLQSPSSATWSVYMYASGADVQELAAESLAAMQELYQGLEATPAVEDFLDEAAIGYDMHFYCLDLLIIGRIRVVEMGRFIYVVVTQGEDRDFADNLPVFTAMTTGVLRSALGIDA